MRYDSFETFVAAMRERGYRTSKSKWDREYLVLGGRGSIAGTAVLHASGTVTVRWDG